MDISSVLTELGAAIVGLAVLSRIARRFGLSAIPLYLLAGLSFGTGGLWPLHLSKEFIHLGAEIGVLLLLFMLGIEYTGQELKTNLRSGFFAGIIDLLLNFPPGLFAGFALGWSPLSAILLGGVTYISSSGVIAKLLADLKWMGNRETPAIVSVLVIEDLTMAIYLPMIGALLIGGGVWKVTISVLIALATVSAVLFVAVRYGESVSQAVCHESDEVVLLTTFGAVLLMSGLAQSLQVSPAIAAFLVGIALAGPICEQSHRLLAPLRDLFAATFFFFFGLQIDPAALPSVLPTALTLGVITAITKICTGYLAAGRTDVDRRARVRAGIALIARGEFSIVIAGLAAGFEPRIGPLSAAYVLFLAILGPILARQLK